MLPVAEPYVFTPGSPADCIFDGSGQWRSVCLAGAADLIAVLKGYPSPHQDEIRIKD
jgi:hypothetical protein